MSTHSRQKLPFMSRNIIIHSPLNDTSLANITCEMTLIEFA